LRIYTVIPFSIGLFFISTYYLYVLPKERRQSKLAALQAEVSS